MAANIDKPYKWRNRAKQYKWEIWLQQDQFELLEGFHFTCGRGAMSQQVRTAAYQRGAKVSIYETDSGMVVTVTQKPSKAVVLSKLFKKRSK